jgi:glycosyltransferase involved in cell wall biosynthesis
MKIAYDASGLTHPRTGVGTYIENLLTGLLRIDHANTYWILAHRDLREGTWRGTNGNSHRAGKYFPNRLLWMQCVLPLALRELRPDLVHMTNFVAPLVSDARVVLTLHDVVLLDSPQWCSPRQRLLMRPLIKPSARRAHAIITVSEQSKRDIVRLFRVPPERVHVIYEASAPGLGQPQDREQARRILRGHGWDDDAQNLLYVGTLEPRKNLERLVEALARIHRQGRRAHLWLVGQRGWQYDRLAKKIAALELEAHVHRTGYVPADHLRAFYQGCDVFVLPSLYEGFGLPALEALTCGAATALADIPALREVAGDAAHYFAPTDAGDMADCLIRLLIRDTLEPERMRARARAAHFTWERAARETLEVYQKVSNQAGCNCVSRRALGVSK